jgi:hypothetical protein
VLSYSSIYRDKAPCDFKTFDPIVQSYEEKSFGARYVEMKVQVRKILLRNKKNVSSQEQKPYNTLCLSKKITLKIILTIQSDSKLLSGFPWPINGNSDNNLESSCIICKYICVTILANVVSLAEQSTFKHKVLDRTLLSIFHQ